MAKDYESMSNEELDRLAAERFEIDLFKDTLWFYYEKFKNAIKLWNPTHPDSNQAERYLFPKVMKSSYIEEHSDSLNYHIKIILEDVNNKEHVISDEIGDIDDKNIIRTIATLKAFDILEKTNEQQ